MHITRSMIEALEERWGTPSEATLSFQMSDGEWNLVARSVGQGRMHDVTLLVLCKDSLAVIRKPSYPDGVWRAPSGGVNVGESIEDGAVRECLEETGLIARPLRYLLRTSVAFSRGGESLQWQSHVFQMSYVSGKPCPVDTREISAARWATLEELSGPIRAAMLASGSGGLAYRAALQELATPLLLRDASL